MPPRSLRSRLRSMRKTASAPYRAYRLKKKMHLRWVGFYSHSPALQRAANQIRHLNDPNLERIRVELRSAAANAVRFQNTMKGFGTSRAFEKEMGRFTLELSRWRLATQPYIYQIALKRAFDRIGLLNAGKGKVERAQLRELMSNFDYELREDSLSMVKERVERILGVQRAKMFLNSFDGIFSNLYLEIGSMNVRHMPF